MQQSWDYPTVYLSIPRPQMSYKQFSSEEEPGIGIRIIVEPANVIQINASVILTYVKEGFCAS